MSRSDQIGVVLFLIFVYVFLKYYPRNKYLTSNDWSNIWDYKKRKGVYGIEVRILPKGHILEGEKGVFATTHFSQYDVIGEYTGVIRKYDSVDNKNRYLFTLIDDLVIDAQDYGNELRFINGNKNISQEPNVVSRNCQIGGVPRVLYLCISNIEPGEEILIDYGDEYNEDFLS